MSEIVRLLIARQPDCVVFSCEKGDGVRLAPERWALHDVIGAASGKTARVGSVLRLLDLERAEAADGWLRVTWFELSSLEPSELVGLGLPPRSPFSIHLYTQAEITEPEFRIGLRYRHPDGRFVLGGERFGSFLNVGGVEYTIPVGALKVVDQVERFNEGGDRPLDERMKAWAEIREQLGESDSADDRLSDIRVAFASSFQLVPFINANGEPDFDARIGRVEVSQSPSGELRRNFSSVLPENRQKDFHSQFRSRVFRPRYAVGEGWYLVMSDRMREALEVVRDVQASSSDVRRNFVLNPSGFLRERLRPDGDGTEFEDVLLDDGYSDRVRGLGLWQPRVLPWLQRPSTEWLPPEHFGLKIDGIDRPIEIPGSDLEPLLGQLSEAVANAQPSVGYGDYQIPATSESVEAVRQLAEIAKRPAGEERRPEGEKPDGPANIALLIIDNENDSTFRVDKRPRPGEVGRFPSALSARLLPHQEEAVRWLQTHWTSGSRGALLADDMGLGKTLQALVFLSWLREEAEQGRARKAPCLIVAPTGLLKNWQDEHEKHLVAPGLGALGEAYGSGLRQFRTTGGANERKAGQPLLDSGRLTDFDWVMTTYETLRDYQISFGRVPWSAVVFDETQKIKNPAAAVSDAAKVVASKADFVLAMTGTPVENRLADLWSIVDTTTPGFFESLKEFSRKYECEDVSTDTLLELNTRVTGGTSPQLMLRRMKEDHLKGLPEKTEIPIRVEMPPEQASAYDSVVSRARGGQEILWALQQLRMVSLHPRPRDPEESDEKYISQSARWKATFEVLDRVADRKEKALVFCEFLEAQSTLCEILQRRYGLDRPPLVISGEVGGAVRKSRVDDFQQRHGFDVMVLSPRAGGVGLTITAANHVIHLTRWWNPAVEDQCTDRVYRIGQNRKVKVYYPIAEHPSIGDRSFDIKLDSLLRRKRDLSRSVLLPGAMDRADFQALFSSTIGDAG